MLSSLIVAFDEPDGTISSQGQTHTVGRGSIPTTQARRASRRTSFLIAGGAVILLGTIVFLSQQRSAQPIDSTEPSPVLDPARARAENTARPARPTASPGPSLEALSAVKTLLSAQQFLLATPARYEPFGEDLTFDRGYILVFETDPKISLASIEKRPVLYIGAVPAEVFDVSPSSGRVIAFAPGDIDLAETPIFFGSTLPAEKVDATRGRAERDAAIALGVSPPPAHELAGAVAAGGALLQAREIGELTRHLGDIRAAWSKVDAGSVRIGSRSQ